MFRWWLGLSLFFVSLLVQAQTLTTEQKLSDFKQLQLSIESSYGPFDYKIQTQGLNYQKISQDYAQKIANTKSNAEFYYAMVQYISEFHDGHFGGSIVSNYMAQIPVETDLVAGEVLIDRIDRTQLSETAFPFAKGDAIVSIDGRPTEEVLKELMKHVGSGYSLSEKRTAAQILFIRRGSRLPVPTGKIQVGIRRGTSDIVESVSLEWKVTGTPLDEKFRSVKKSPASASTDLLDVRPQVQELLGERLERSFRCSGETRIAIPENATMVMEKPFVAYYHPTEKGNVGYLRIPHYMFVGPKGEPMFDEVFQQYEYAIQVLEKNTVGLIIDQDHNCGGSVSFLYSMASLFVKGPFQPIQFQLLATKKEYLMFKAEYDQTVNNSLVQIGLKKVMDLIQAAWTAGQRLTEKTDIDGMDSIYPNRIQYTKPIVMLIDELAGSGGDAFPSLMGGLKRAKLLGTRTWGLGGHVQDFPALNYSGFNYRMTKSLFYRPDGVAVENNGAVPDVGYQITRDDFMYGYKNYQKFYLKTLLEEIQ